MMSVGNVPMRLPLSTETRPQQTGQRGRIARGIGKGRSICLGPVSSFSELHPRQEERDACPLPTEVLVMSDTAVVVLLAGIVNLVLLAWFISTLNSINRGIKHLNNSAADLVHLVKKAVQSQPIKETANASVRFVCHNCQQENTVSRNLVGKKVLCTNCDAPCKVPES
jgi:hypothetical protein